MKNIKVNFMDIFFSVIMPVTLEMYEGAANNRVEKFRRAVKSLLTNLFPDAHRELIIVSDGCELSEAIFKDEFSMYKNLRFYKIPKQPLFSGNVRQFGLNKSRGEYILYLDSDDVIGEWHLTNIQRGLKANSFPDWAYYDDYIVRGIRDIALKKVYIQHGSIGTSSICHKRLPEFTWEGCDGYGHDWTFIQKLMKHNNKPPKLAKAQYFIHHIPNLVDF